MGARPGLRESGEGRLRSGGWDGAVGWRGGSPGSARSLCGEGPPEDLTSPPHSHVCPLSLPDHPLVEVTDSSPSKWPEWAPSGTSSAAPPFLPGPSLGALPIPLSRVRGLSAASLFRSRVSSQHVLYFGCRVLTRGGPIKSRKLQRRVGFRCIEQQSSRLHSDRWLLK